MSTDKTIKSKTRRFSIWHFVWMAILFSLILTTVINLILHGEVRRERLFLGFIVPAIVAPIVIRIQEKLKRELEESEEKYRSLFEHSIQGIGISKDDKFIVVNKALLDLEGYSDFDEFVKVPISRRLTPASVDIITERRNKRQRGEYVDPYVELEAVRRDGEIRNVEVSTVEILIKGEKYFLSTLVDISDRKKAEADRERVIVELRDAISKVKTLSGLLPICSSCKKIRDYQGYWKQVETYIQEHADVDFSHGICPDCAKKLYPEHYDKSWSEKGKEA